MNSPEQEEIQALHELVEKEIARIEAKYKIQLYGLKLKDPVEFRQPKGVRFLFVIDGER